jgi:hypothetical protein
MPAFNCSTSILIAAARIALEPSKQISRVETAGEQSKRFRRHLHVDKKWGFAFYTDEGFRAHLKIT